MKVLVVDDVAAVRTRVAAMLGEVAGVDAVLQAGDSEQALSLVRECAPRIVVLDLHLRGESGLSLAPLLKRESPGVLLVVLTNDPSEHHRRECMAHGADFFFDKSHDFDRVVELVARMTTKSARAARSRPPFALPPTRLR